MAALTCEICGGKLVGKPGGVFECDSCGMEYSTEWAKAKIQEIRGTVQVEGTVEVTGTVKVEGGANKESLLKRGYLLLEDSDWKGADECFDQVLNMDPECAEAYVGRFCAKCHYKRIVEMTEDPQGFRSGTMLPGIRQSVNAEPILKALNNGRKIEAIKLYRELTGVGLPEAKDAEEKIQSEGKAIIGTNDFEKALRFASPELRTQLEGYRSIALQQTQKVREQREEERRQAEEARRQEEEAHRLQAAEEARRAEEQKRLLAERRALIRPAASCVSIVNGIVIAVKADGTLLWTGEASSDKEIWNQYRETALSWKNILQVVPVKKGPTQTFGVIGDSFGVIGVRMDGSLVWAGTGLDFLEDEAWADLTAVVHTVMSAGIGYRTHHAVFVGLKRDGRVVVYVNGVTERNELSWKKKELNKWDDLTKIVGGENYIAGLKSDGTVVYTSGTTSNLSQIKDWTGIVDIAAFGKEIIGLREDGTVAVTGVSSFKQEIYSSWTDIAALGDTKSLASGIKCDGTVVTDLRYDKPLEEQLSAWSDLVAVFDNFDYIVGVKEDGTLVWDKHGRKKNPLDLNGWKLFDHIETLEQERKEAQAAFEQEYKEEQAALERERAQRRAALEAERTALQNELANLKGLFSGKRRKEIETRLAAIAKELEE